jgi:uncharacterized cupredoxin-like copper-binding protein
MKTRTYATMAAAMVALTAGLVACGDDKSSSTTAPAAPATTAAAATTAAGATTAPATGTTVNISVGETSDTAMFLKSDLTSVKAGHVTFVVTNNGKKDHEVVVLKTDTPFDQLAIDPATNKVSEDGNVGETGEPDMKPGDTRTFEVDLTAGNYALVCNIEKHYGMGMRAAFTVTA